MLMVDDERRYVEANRGGRLAFRLTLDELRSLRIDDLTPPEFWPVMEAQWARLLRTGCVAGPYEVVTPADGGEFTVIYYGLANALPHLHVISFALAGWSEEELGIPSDPAAEPEPQLTSRELDVVQLAAQGGSGPQIADELVLSPATVKKHFENIYRKLGVTDRAAAVATAMRLGLID